MSSRYEIDQQGTVTIIRFFETPSYEETTLILDILAEKELYEKRLWDLTLIKFDFTMEEIKAIAEYGKKAFIKPNKSAFLAKDDLAFGEMRMLEVYRGQKEFAESRAFRDLDEAFHWLNEADH